MSWSRRFVSWLNGRTIGEVRYMPGLPYISFNLSNMSAMMATIGVPSPRTQKDLDDITFHFWKQEWDGYDWKCVEKVDLKRSELINLIEGGAKVYQPPKDTP